MTPEQMLREFHLAKAVHGGLLPDQPTADIPAWVRDLRIDLLAEEVEELRLAMLAGDVEKIADGVADVVFVAVGTAVVCGLPFDDLLSEVFDSNMTKINSSAEAKLIKGPDYRPPDIRGVLFAHFIDTQPGGSASPTQDCGGPRRPPAATELWFCQRHREFHEPAKDRS